MQNLNVNPERRTSADVVFDSLYDDIVSLRLLPGSRMSVVEVAEKFDVSRQPVRDAFNRLGNLDLLLIRPQKATVVRGFSMQRIEEARFLRLAIELEVFRTAALVWEKSHSTLARDNIAEQQRAVAALQWDTFHAVDGQFHALVCKISGCDFAIRTIETCRQKMDRLCALSFNREREVEAVLDDHNALVTALERNDPSACADIIRLHLTRLDSVIAEIRLEHSEYFE